jgi:uncharacterized protein (TIGR02597 family)
MAQQVARGLACGLPTYAMGMLALLTVPAGAQTPPPVATPPSGFVTISIAGTGGVGASKLTFIGLALTRPVDYQGNLESFAANAVTDTQANWADDAFNGASGQHYLEITSGPNAGTLTDVVDTIAATKTVVTADDLSSKLSGGETYKIRKHWTIGSIFGSSNEAGLGGGSSVTADQILIYNPQTSGYTIYYYQTSGLGGTGWRAAGNPFASQTNAKVPLQQGLIIARKQSSGIEVKLFGAVKLGPTSLHVEVGTSIIGNVYPAGSLTLGNSNLYTGDPSTGLSGGSSVTADQVLIYNSATGGYAIYYYQTSGLGGTGWRAAGNPFGDASATGIPLTGSVVINRKHAGAFNWVVPQAF